ncbi:hypothetical protein G6F43_012475 [Rhizopus delemar]|nr:hypothetical protein G6F43_012475 [Rhizopus delemar]
MKRQRNSKDTEHCNHLGNKESSQDSVIEAKTEELTVKRKKGEQVPENSDVLWTMTPQQSADLKALHESIQLGTATTNHHQQEENDASSTEDNAAQPIVIPNEEEQRPPVGSEEWHRRRRESHKLVERKRREAINDGINEIARIVPGCEKNKGSILSRAVSYIKQLKEQEVAILEKSSLEKLLTEQTINQLKQQVDMLKEHIKELARQSDNLRAELDAVKTENNYLKDRLQPFEKLKE